MRMHQSAPRFIVIWLRKRIFERIQLALYSIKISLLYTKHTIHKLKVDNVLPTEKQYVQWLENTDGNDTFHNARWLSESNHLPPARIVLVDDKTTADEAYRLACEGTSLLWRGDFHNAKQLLQALARRIERTNERSEQRKIKKAANKAA